MGTFSNMESLAILNMGDNFINEIQDDFSGISANTQLLLQNNQIRQLNETAFRPLVEKIMNTPLATGLIDLENNPLDCSCDVKWIIIDLGALVFSVTRAAPVESILPRLILPVSSSSVPQMNRRSTKLKKNIPL